MAVLMQLCFRPLKDKYHRVPSKAGWLLVLPVLIAVIAKVFPLSAVTTLMLIVTLLLCYYVIRMVVFLGLTASYRAYRERHPSFKLSPLHAILAWSLSVLEPLAIVGIITLSYLIGFPGKMDVRGMAEVLYWITIISTCGIALSFVFLLGLYALRRQMSGGAKNPVQVKSASAATVALDAQRARIASSQTRSFSKVSVSGKSASPDKRP